ncbi:MAG: hypothetical protein DMG57_29440 [Acidobacteria bacterium]|nr:MAG: hypothetical protein DMG57_29440 [Acidobacteriota bacterium]
MDVQRFEQDLAAVTPGRQIRPLTVYGNAENFRNGYIATYTAGLDRDFGDVKVNASYVAIAGVGLAAMWNPNGYGGAEPAFAPFTRFDAAGHVLGGFGPESVLTNRSHSTFHFILCKRACKKLPPASAAVFRSTIRSASPWMM